MADIEAKATHVCLVLRHATEPAGPKLPYPFCVDSGVSQI